MFMVGVLLILAGGLAIVAAVFGSEGSATLLDRDLNALTIFLLGLGSGVAVWWTLPAEVLAEAGLSASELPGAAHAAEHCSIGLLPLFATCDRWDIGGVSTAHHPDTGRLTVFVYDGHPGGAGFAERGFRVAGDWLAATRASIAACECLDGCPSCIQSPKCGNQNHPLDKPGALRLLDALLASRP